MSVENSCSNQGRTKMKKEGMYFIGLRMITKGNIARFIGLCGVVYILIDPTNSVDLILELIK